MTKYCALMKQLRHIANTNVVPWEWLREYAKESKAVYLADFIEEAEEVYKHERASGKS